MPDTAPVSFSHAFRLLTPGGVPVITEAAKTVIRDESITVTYNGLCSELSYREISEAKAENYRVVLTLDNGTTAEFYYLGHDFDSFCEFFFGRYNAMIQKDSFMGEEGVCVKRGSRYEHTGSIVEAGDCDLSLGEHSVIIQRCYGSPARLPYALIDRVDYGPYDIGIAIYGDRWHLSMLGHEYDGFKSQYGRFYQALLKKTKDFLVSLADSTPKAAFPAAAEAFLDGRAVEKKKADCINPGLWDALYEQACAYGYADTFHYLRERSDQLYLGFKDSLIDSAGVYIWMMAQLDSCIVYEAASSTQAGMATYVYQTGGNTAETAGLINYCMHMTEFRREPVYMTMEELKKPGNERYLSAVRRVPQLNKLRSLFLGRIIHSSTDKWIESLEQTIHK